MDPDKAVQFGNDLCCLAASIAEIGEELKTLYDFDGKNPAEAGQRQKKAQKAPSLEQVRSVLADKSRAGFTAQIRPLLQKYGADKLSGVDPANYKALLADAEGLTDAT